MKGQRARILPPYTQRVDDVQHRISKLVAVFALILVAMLMGFVLAIFGLYGWWIPAVPVVTMAIVALWMAPDFDTHLDGAIQRIYFIYLGLALMWPYYIAFNIPGLPWISFQRLAMFGVLAITAYAVATSARLRAEFTSVLSAHPVLIRFFLCWITWHLLMLAVGQFESTSQFMRHTIMWHFFFLVSAWIMVMPGNAQLAHRLIIVGAVWTSAVVIPEYINSKPFWVDYIPGFLGIDPDILESLQFGISRGSDYRSRSIFVNSVVYAEFLGMLIPFVLLALAQASTGVRRLLAGLAFLLLFTAAVLTQARTAMVAFVVTLPTFYAIWVWRRYRTTRGQRDLLGPSLLFSFPAAAATFMVAVLTVPRLRGAVFGGNQHKASNNAREAQWDMALPQIAKNPFGHGMGSIDRVVPYTNGAGKFTVDSYPINLLVEYGVPGFVLFVGFFATAIYIGIRTYLSAESKDEEMAGAAAISILSFLVSRMVLSSEGGQGLAFGFAGAILGLYAMQLRRAPAAQRQGPAAYPATAPRVPAAGGMVLGRSGAIGAR
jgi:O-antigen ligase